MCVLFYEGVRMSDQVAKFAAEIEAELGRGGIDNPDARGIAIIDAVRRLVSRLGDVGPEIKRAIVAAALRVYDAIDTPIPNAIETPLKTALRPAVEQILNHLLGLT